MNLLVGLCDVHKYTVVLWFSFILVAIYFLVSKYVIFTLKQRKTKYVIFTLKQRKTKYVIIL